MNLKLSNFLKSNILLIVVFFSFSFYCSAQWILKYTASSGTEFHRIFVHNEDTVFIAAHSGWGKVLNGLVFITTDGGESWEEIGPGVQEMVLGVTFNNGVCYICGTNGLFAKSSDLGSSWTIMSVSSSLDLHDLSFTDQEHGFIAGSSNEWAISGADSGAIFYTENGGNVISRVFSSDSSGVTRIFALNQDTCFALSNGKSTLTTQTKNSILRSLDNGSTWMKTYTNYNQTTAIDDDHITFCEFFPSGVGYVSTYQKFLLKTFDYGLTWDSIFIFDFTDYVSCFEISYQSELSGYYAGLSLALQYGWIYKTIDGGLSWEGQPSAPFEDFIGIDFKNDSIGYAITQTGRVYKTTNGGIYTSANTIKQQDEILIHPNPAGTSLTIKTSTSFQCHSMRFYNISGRLVIQKDCITNPEIIDVSSCPSGVYFVLIYNEDMILWQEKVVIL